MSLPPRLFDRRALRLHAARARRLATEARGSDFLLTHAREDLALRLTTVQRPFPTAVDLFSPGDGAASALATGERFVVHARAPWDEANSATAMTVADPDALPFGGERLDLVVSLLALQWCEDIPGLLAQVRRALRPDGLFLACLVGGRSLHELRDAFARAEAELEGGARPHVIPFADLRDAGALLQRAGFALPVTDVENLTVRYGSALALMADLRAMGAANPLLQRAKNPMRRATLARAAAIYAADHADADGRVRATFELIWLSGWAPHESQQKPLKPGSATHSLAEALRPRTPDAAASES